MKPTTTTDTAINYCKASAQSSGSNFVTAFQLLPIERRHALYAFYTLCREMDDIADATNLSVTEKQTALEKWRQEIAACYQGTASHPATQVLQTYVRPFAIPQQYLLDILEGVRMDLTISSYANFSELYTYCYRVAGAVGVVCTYIFGCTRPEAYLYAENLGVAFQLTNILRDVSADLARQRLYLPLDELAAANYSLEALKQHDYSPAYYRLMQQQYERARDYYDRAAHLLPPEDKRALLPARLMTVYYRSLLEKIRRQRFHVLDRHIRLSRTYKLYMLARHLPQVIFSS